MHDIEDEGSEIKLKWVSGIVSKQEKRGRKGGEEGREDGSVKLKREKLGFSFVSSVPFGKVRGLLSGRRLSQRSVMLDFCVTSSSNRLITEAIRLASHRMSLSPYINSTRTHVPGIGKYL